MDFCCCCSFFYYSIVEFDSLIDQKAITKSDKKSENLSLSHSQSLTSWYYIILHMKISLWISMIMKEIVLTHSLALSFSRAINEPLRICLVNWMSMFKWRGHFGDAINNGPLFEPGKMRILLALAFHIKWAHSIHVHQPFDYCWPTKPNSLGWICVSCQIVHFVCFDVRILYINRPLAIIRADQEDEQPTIVWYCVE